MNFKKIVKKLQNKDKIEEFLILVSLVYFLLEYNLIINIYRFYNIILNLIGTSKWIYLNNKNI